MKITNTNLKLTEDVIFTNFSKNEGSQSSGKGSDGTTKNTIRVQNLLAWALDWCFITT